MAASDPEDAVQEHPAGETGGAEQITLSPKDIPQLLVTPSHHVYSYRLPPRTVADPEACVGGVNTGGNATGIGMFSGTNYLEDALANRGNANPVPISHMPPYLAVDAWVRTE
jgi:hypothetical protein